MTTENKRLKVIGILLAAGQSTRFGSTNKCLHPLSNGNAIGLQSAQNLSKAVDKVVCIVPPDNVDLTELFHKNGFTTIPNKAIEKGMSASIRLGIEYSLQNKEFQACLIALADMPFIQAETIEEIVNNLTLEQSIAAPYFKGKRGHPVGFSRDYFTTLSQLKGDKGAKSLIESEKGNLQVVEVNDFGVLHDIDYQEDLKKSLNQTI